MKVLTSVRLVVKCLERGFQKFVQSSVFARFTDTLLNNFYQKKCYTGFGNVVRNCLVWSRTFDFRNPMEFLFAVMIYDHIQESEGLKQRDFVFSFGRTNAIFNVGLYSPFFCINFGNNGRFFVRDRVENHSFGLKQHDTQEIGRE